MLQSGLAWSHSARYSSFLNACIFTEPWVIHPGLLHQMCDQEWIQQLGRGRKCSVARAVVDPGDSRTTDCFGLSAQRAGLCLKLLWCQKMGSPGAGKSSFSKGHIDLNREKTLEVL